MSSLLASLLARGYSLGWLRWLFQRLPSGLRGRAHSRMAERLASANRFRRTERWEDPLPGWDAIASSSPQNDDRDGVNIVGFIRGDFGLGECARRYAGALLRNGIRTSLYDVDLNLPHGRDNHSLDRWITNTLPHAFSIVFVNPDFLDAAIERIGRLRLQQQYVIACWFWELETVPEAWRPAVELVDEIMVASEFMGDAFRQVTEKPILRVPIPVEEPWYSRLERSDFGLEEGRFMFLCSFDFDSWLTRKNPFAVVEAFSRAFPPGRDDIGLLIKSSNGDRYPKELLALLEATSKDPRIMVRDEIIEKPHFTALQRCCDAYVSLHRSEGFGLALAECMVMGIPVIATQWSGNLEFMDTGNSVLIPCVTRRVEAGEYPHADEAYWAEPSVPAAAEAMRRLADERSEARLIGLRGQRDVRARLAPEKIAAAIMERIGFLSCGMKERKIDNA